MKMNDFWQSVSVSKTKLYRVQKCVHVVGHSSEQVDFHRIKELRGVEK